ncbi:hypothetical protein [uncultured Anaerovibrio sp.]|uniref:hypothetical protein n=1 Tax=uncultured Anaerovibrio sp. TaxID=361586 RepID=UPI002622AF42|nr:hypothetical protein [uncultured Anaerovibrio sp.]
MAVKEKQDKDKTRDNSLRKRQIWMGAAAITVLVLALFFLFNRQEPPTAAQEPEVGVMDMGRLIRAHRDYGKLQTMMRETAALEAELKLTGFEMTAEAAKADNKLFEDAARQKANLEIINHYLEKSEELKVRADELYKKMKPQFDREQEAIDQEYGNRILNIQIKADNASTLELSEAERARLQAEWNRLKDERDDRHNKLLADQRRRYEAEVERVLGDDRRSMIAEHNKIKDDAKAEEMKHLLQVQDRNTQAIDEAMKPIQRKMDLAKKKNTLELKLTEMKLLEKKIFDDICSRAAKLAIVHHLNLIIADPMDNILEMEYNSLGFGRWHEPKSPVIGINALDLTQEMLQEIKNIQ